MTPGPRVINDDAESESVVVGEEKIFFATGKALEIAQVQGPQFRPVTSLASSAALGNEIDCGPANK